MKRSASAPKAGMPCGNSLPRLRRDPRRILGLAQARGALFEQRVERDAVDQVDRVQRVALGLRHLLAVVIAHDAVDVDVAKRHPAGEPGRHHDHPGDPEEDDVEAGDQDRRGQVKFVGSPSSPCGVWPAERRVAHQRRREPGVEHVRVALERRAAGLGACLGFAARDVDLARWRRTTPGSDVPTIAGARCTSPGCWLSHWL